MGTGKHFERYKLGVVIVNVVNSNWFWLFIEYFSLYFGYNGLIKRNILIVSLDKLSAVVDDNAEVDDECINWLQLFLCDSG